ncbi:MAG: ABC transporter permease [Patescibacteria group bacterium]
MSTAASKLRFIAGYLKLNLSMAMAYRGSFLLQTLFMAVNDTVLLFFWWLVLMRLPNVAGWGFRNILALYACSATAFGIGASFCSNFLNLSRLVAEGQLDYYLATPQDPFLHVLVAKGWFAGFGDILFGLCCLVFAGGGAWRFAVFPLAVLAGAAVFVSFGFIYHSLSFWWGRSEALSGMAFESLLTFSLWPGEIFPPLLRIVFLTIIPAGFVAHLPVRLLQKPSMVLLLFLAGAALLSILMARAVFMRGLKRYESGNLVAMRD